VLPPVLAAFADDAARGVSQRLGAALVGVYLAGSAAVDDVWMATSDLDLVAVSASAVSAATRDALVDDLLRLAAQAPVRRLEFVLYRRDQAARPDGSFELNLNAGPRMATRVEAGRGASPDFWFIIDAALLRATARALVGPPAEELFGPVADDDLRAALDRSLAWHRDHGDRPHASVLTACRAWHFTAERRWASKSAAGRWAAARDAAAAALIRAALAYREGTRRVELPAAQAAAFVEQVRQRLQAPAGGSD